MLHPPSADAFPASPPHAVPAYSRARWSFGLSRWWHALFARNAYARGPDTPSSGRAGGHRFFQHLIETDEAAPTAAPDRAESKEK
jgi:hypothetical protein